MVTTEIMRIDNIWKYSIDSKIKPYRQHIFYTEIRIWDHNYWIISVIGVEQETRNKTHNITTITIRKVLLILGVNTVSPTYMVRATIEVK